MSSVLTTPAAPHARPGRRKQCLAAGFAALFAAASIAVVPWNADRGARVESKPTTSAAPLILGDPPVAKGAHGEESDDAMVRVFGDPTVRKGAGGR